MSRSDGVIEIELNNGFIALVDSDDVHLLGDTRWTAARWGRGDTWYAVSGVGGKHRSMHALIMQPPQGMEVGHKNGNGLDNRRSNLRVCTHQQNLSNQRKHGINTLSKYKGVTRDKAGWKAQIECQGKRLSKRFKTEAGAALFYNEKAQELFGEYARLNEVKDVAEIVTA